MLCHSLITRVRKNISASPRLNECFIIPSKYTCTCMTKAKVSMNLPGLRQSSHALAEFKIKYTCTRITKVKECLHLPIVQDKVHMHLQMLLKERMRFSKIP